MTDRHEYGCLPAVMSRQLNSRRAFANLKRVLFSHAEVHTQRVSQSWNPTDRRYTRMFILDGTRKIEETLPSTEAYSFFHSSRPSLPCPVLVFLSAYASVCLFVVRANVCDSWTVSDRFPLEPEHNKKYLCTIFHLENDFETKHGIHYDSSIRARWKRMNLGLGQ